MSTNLVNEDHDPVANLHMQPAKGILKTTKSTDDPKQDSPPVVTHAAAVAATSGMTRSESKSHKIPHFDEMNIIATYHPADKDYGHMKIEEPKTPYAPNDIIEEELATEPTTTTPGIDPNALAERLKETTVPSSTPPRFQSDRLSRRSTDDETNAASDQIEHRKEFENHRKKHYNEFEIVRLRKKEIEAELRALEQEESATEPERKGSDRMSSSRSSVDSIKPILIHPHSRDSSSSSGHHHHHHVQVIEDEHEHVLTPEEQERKKEFESKRKKHYNEFRAARLADKDDDDSEMTG